MVLKIIRWMFGYVTFKVDSKRSNFFLNLSSKFNMHLWDISKIDKDLVAKINSSEFGILNNLSRRNNINLNIIRRTGLPFFYQKHEHRKGILVGATLFFSIIHVLSMFIWKINVIGNESIDTQKIVNVSRENGIFAGCLRKKIDAQIAGQNIMEEIPDISWISVNLDGCVANISIKEQVKKPEFEQNPEKCHIVAECDAQIFRMETFSGTPMVSAGDTVLKNQVLVGAFDKDIDGNLRDANAKANVWAKVSDTISESEKLEKTLDLETGNEKKIFKINLFGKSFSLNFWENPEDSWKKEIYEKKFKIFGFEIPLSFSTEKFIETKQTKVNITKDEAFELAKKRVYEKMSCKNLDIIEISESKLEKEDEIIFKIDFQYLKNIAKYDKQK